MGCPECELLGHGCLQSPGCQSSRKSVILIVPGNGQSSPNNLISPSRLNAPVARCAQQYQRYILAKSIPLWLLPLRAKTAASEEAE
jgi:hypothetical protein